jgi:hypothetical protein
MQAGKAIGPASLNGEGYPNSDDDGMPVPVSVECDVDFISIAKNRLLMPSPSAMSARA